jgi:asparagine synthase (glutamine-hydrolysing)
MCGFAGFMQSGLRREKWEAILEKMAQAVHHRGPDNKGVWIDEKTGVGFAHCRLSIIDPSPEGNQPMVSTNGRYIIVYNGEVYNFLELRKELELYVSKPWRSRSDTEVILAAIEVWGLEKAVSRFIGMFAFALWDRNEQVLYLVRDRVGIKPLYYGVANGVFLFGSELKSFRLHPAFTGEVDRNALTLLFRYGYIPAPYSIYKGVCKLLPGAILSVRGGPSQGDFYTTMSNYWSAKKIVEAGQRELFTTANDEVLDVLDSLLRDAVKKRMISDVPLGAFLSGGIDSSTIVALMQLQSNRPIKTFTVGFYEKEADEAPYARKISHYLGTEHTEFYVTPQEAMTVIPKLPTIYDEPFSDSSQIPTFLISQLTRQYVTVSLSGDGGDELFGGYNRYFWNRDVWRKIERLPKRIRVSLSRALTLLSPANWEKILKVLRVVVPLEAIRQSHGDKLHTLAGMLAVEDYKGLYHYVISHWKEPASLVIGASEPPTVLTDSNEWADLSNFTDWMMFIDLISYLPDDILTKVDRASMSVSLEVRVPLLDHRIIEFAWRIPHSMKIRSAQSKWLLRQILYRYIPRELIERPKKGFSVPIADWLRGPLRDWAENLLDEKRLQKEGFLNPIPIRQKWREHLSGKRNWHHHLWDVLMFQGWLEKWGN